jgi:hypothetical protein
MRIQDYFCFCVKVTFIISFVPYSTGAPIFFIEHLPDKVLVSAVDITPWNSRLTFLQSILQPGI